MDEMIDPEFEEQESVEGEQGIPLLLRIGKDQIALTLGTLTASGIADVALHLDKTGVFMGLLATFVVGGMSDHILDAVVPGRDAARTRDLTERALNVVVPAGQAYDDQRAIAKIKRIVGIKAKTPVQLKDADDLQPAQGESQASTMRVAVERFMPNDLVRRTERNSYLVCIGRSLTRPGNPAIWVSFAGQHLKLIGASQYGKSSMAAALLYLITRTHTPDTVLVALLDREHRTSKLFANIPHLAEYTREDGQRVLLHAKNDWQVLEHLRYVVAVISERGTFGEVEVEQEPILLVYLEEFLELKDFFKGQTKREYAEFISLINTIARIGLKVKVQLLLCAQVDYRDDDLQEALVNVSAGMSFCVRASAAQAAGFVDAKLLARNVMEDQKGQAVAQMRGCKDLVLAPEFDLTKKLLAFEQAMRGHQPTARRASTLTGSVYLSVNDKQPLNTSVNIPVNAPIEPSQEDEQGPFTEPFINVPGQAQNPGRVPVSDEMRKQIHRMRKTLKMPHRQISRIIGLYGPQYELYKQVCAEEGISMVEKEEEV